MSLSGVQHARNLAAYDSNRDPDRHCSPAIWSDFPLQNMLEDPTTYLHWFDDFHNIPVLTTASGAINRYPYMSYIDTGNTITTLATVKTRGVLRLATDATDNDGPVINMQGNDGVQVMLDDNTTADRKKLWFESRWSKSSITDNQAAMFIGFAEEARAVDNGVLADNDGTYPDIDIIGYRVLQDNGEELDFAFRKNGQTAVEISAGMVTTSNADAAGLAVDTFIKTGFVYDPREVTSKRIRLLINNIEDSDYTTATQMAAATFPDGEELCFTAGVKNGEATAVNFDLDWIRFAQEMLSV